MNEEDMTNNELMIFFDGKFDSFKRLFDRIDESLKEIKIDLKESRSGYPRQRRRKDRPQCSD